MAPRAPLVGRHEERERLLRAARSAAAGEGAVLLLSGEAGVGKSRLAAELAESSPTLQLRGAASSGAPTPYGPLVAALRSHLRANPHAFADCGRLLPHLALLLPELGEAAAESDRATIFEAARCALERLAEDRGAIVVLDDMHWSDEASVELLAALAEPLREMPILIVVGYRSSGLPREHPLRRLRNELRRGGAPAELTLEPLDLERTAELLAALLGEQPAPSLSRAIHDRTRGLPFFVEELVAALMAQESLAKGARGIELAGERQTPLPETIRDAVSAAAAELSPAARTAAEIAAVAGEEFGLGMVAGLGSEEGVAELLEHGLIVEAERGGAFRHALAREAIYAEVPWLRRRELHMLLAEEAERRSLPALELATHRLGAGETGRAREALVRSARQSEAMLAHRDAADAARRALDLWPEEEAEEERIETLERYAACSQRAGDPAEAARA